MSIGCTDTYDAMRARASMIGGAAKHRRVLLRLAR